MNPVEASSFKLHSILDHHHPEHHDNHVHFDENAINEDLEADNSIGFQKVDAERNVIGVHLGFLQINHRYKLDLQLPIEICAALKTLDSSKSVELIESVPNHCCKLIECQNRIEKSTGLFIGLSVEFLANKEKLLKHEFSLTLNKTTPIQIIFTARVLGKGKGTPLLRNGVQSIGVEADDDESSDAQK